MADSVSAIPAPSPDPSVQFAQALEQSNEVNSANFLAAINHSDEVAASNRTAVNPATQPQTQTQAQSANDFPDALLALDTPSLSLLNEFSTDPRSATISGNLTTQQLQDIAVLQEDTIKLQEAAGLTTNTPLGSSATTVDLSADAQGIADGSVLPSQLVAAQTLSTAQLQQFGQILAPYANQPLTQPLFLQLQASVAAAGFSPLQFNLSTLFSVLQYIATMVPANTNTQAAVAANANNDDDVPPITETAEVGAVAEQPGTLVKMA